jgi:hypothetical protein
VEGARASTSARQKIEAVGGSVKDIVAEPAKGTNEAR